MPRSSATYVADDVKEGGLGLGFSEPELAATLGSLRLSLSSCGHPPPWFLCSVELRLSLLLLFWCRCFSLTLSSLQFPTGLIACFHCRLARTPFFLP